MRLSGKQLRRFLREVFDPASGFNVIYTIENATGLHIVDSPPQHVEIPTEIFDVFNKYLQLMEFSKNDVEVHVVVRNPYSSFPDVDVYLFPRGNSPRQGNYFIFIDFVEDYASTYKPTFWMPMSDWNLYDMRDPTWFLGLNSLEEMPEKLGVSLFAAAIRASLSNSA